MPRDDNGAARTIVDASGRPARQAINTDCPRCGAEKDRRVPSAGFGTPHEVCGRCGYEFTERTP